MARDGAKFHPVNFDQMMDCVQAKMVKVRANDWRANDTHFGARGVWTHGGFNVACQVKEDSSSATRKGYAAKGGSQEAPLICHVAQVLKVFSVCREAAIGIRP